MDLLVRLHNIIYLSLEYHYFCLTAFLNGRKYIVQMYYVR
jgi:hypothetical protein